MRYFARFKEDFGYLRATARNGEIRKSIVTPLVINRDQLSRLNTLGYIDPVQGEEDMRLDGRLREYTATAWEVFNELLAAGTFATTPAESISTAIFNRSMHKRHGAPVEIGNEPKDEGTRQEQCVPKNAESGTHSFSHILKDSFAKERRLNIAAQIVASMVGSDDWTTWRGGTNKEIWHNMAKSSLEIADALIDECEKKGGQDA